VKNRDKQSGSLLETEDVTQNQDTVRAASRRIKPAGKESLAALGEAANERDGARAPGHSGPAADQDTRAAVNEPETEGAKHKTEPGHEPKNHCRKYEEKRRHERILGSRSEWKSKTKIEDLNSSRIRAGAVSTQKCKQER
jgi:hypothetical protein